MADFEEIVTRDALLFKSCLVESNTLFSNVFNEASFVPVLVVVKKIKGAHQIAPCNITVLTVNCIIV